MTLPNFLKKYHLQEGDLVEIVHPGPNGIGYIIPSLDATRLKLKLKSGYNQSFPLKSIKKITKLPGEKKVGKAKAVAVKKNRHNSFCIFYLLS